MSGVVREIKVKEGQKVKVGQVIFTLQGGAVAEPPTPRNTCPVEHLSGQQGARLAFQPAMRAEGKTEEQALPPDHPQLRAESFSMPLQLGKVAGTEHREPVPAAPHVRRLAREIGVDIYRCSAVARAAASVKMMLRCARKMLSQQRPCGPATPRGTFAEPELPDFAKWGKIERVSMRGVRRKTAEHLRRPGTRSLTSRSTIARISRSSSSCAPSLRHVRKKLAAR